MKQRDPQNKLGTVHLSNRCVETSAQVQQVLSVISTLSGCLGGFRRQNILDEEHDTHPLKMSEGEIALEKTLWAACARMEAILNEPARWDDTFQRKVEKDYDDLHAKQMETITKQQEAAAEINSPHFRYRPELHKLRDGGWLAVIGDVNQLEFAIYGTGNSPQAAIEAFDRAFISGVPQTVYTYCLERERLLNAGSKDLPPFPNKEQTHEKNDDQNLDSNGSSAS